MSRQYYKTGTYHSKNSIGYLLRRGRTLITAEVETLFNKRFGDGNISFVHWVILMCLRDDLASTPSELSNYVCYDSGALTRVIDQMEKRRLIKRERNSKDRRVVKLKLLPEGKKTVESLIVVVVDFYNQLLSGFTHAEIDTLLHLLTRLVGKLDHFGKED